MALMIVEFVNPSAARAEEGRMILHYYVHLLDTGAQGRKYSVRARARASRKIRGTGSRGRVVVPLRKMIIFGGDIETTTFFSLILSPNRGNPSLQDRLVREYIYIVSIKVFFFFSSSAATLAPDANQYRRVNTFRDPVFFAESRITLNRQVSGSRV